MISDQKKEAVSTAVQFDLSENAPDYENNIRSKYPGYNVFFIFPTCPIPEERALAFPAYVKNVTDTFTPSYDPRTVYGRMDPIPIYQRTTRAITFDLDMPSSGLAQSMENAKKLNILVKNTYPSYQTNGSVKVISSPPLVKILFSNLIFSTVGKSSILGYFTSPIAISHDLEKGVFVRDDGFETYAKSYSLKFSINVLHGYTPGYSINEERGTIFNPVNILGGSRSVLSKG